MTCCRRCGATWKIWCASSRCGPTRPAAARCSAAPRRWQSCCRRPGSAMCRSSARVAHRPSSPGIRRRRARRRCCCMPITMCSPRAIPTSGCRRRFEPTERDGRLYGRGSADDKAGIATHLAAFRAHGGQPPVGVTVFVEGEEESGSPSLGRLLAAHKETLAADVIVIADSDNWSTDVPALTVSLRGLADCVVEVATLDHGLHSGLWGGVVPDALSVLVRLLASLARRRRQRRGGRVCTRRLPPTWTTRRSGCGKSPACSTGCPRSVPAQCHNGFGPSPPSRSSGSTPRRSHRRRTH